MPDLGLEMSQSSFYPNLGKLGLTLYLVTVLRQQLVKKATFLLQKNHEKKFDVPGILHLESKVWYICR